MNSPADTGRICAVIVAFNPVVALDNAALRIAPQVGGTIVVDNSTDPTAVAHVDWAARRAGAERIRNSKNLGVATALNQGVARAIEMGFGWALTLDQDSVPHGDAASVLIETFRAATRQMAKHERQIAMVGVDLRRFLRRGSQQESKRDFGWKLASTIITSGCLLSLEAYLAIGPFRDDLFIDLVDTEYCLRARTRGFVIASVAQQPMDHRIGTPTRHQLGWRATFTSNHPTVRRYYMSRNMILLFKVYVLSEPRSVLFVAWSWVKSTILMVLFEPNRGGKLKALVAGIIDGCQMPARP